MPNRLNLGPLTTVFTPPTACSTGVLYMPTPGQVDARLWGAGVCEMISGGAYPGFNTKCYPPGMFNIPTASATRFLPEDAGYMPIYSPGLSCPHGFYSACSSTKQAGETAPTSGAALWSALSAGETVIGCCPSGYTCGTGDDGAGMLCGSRATSGEVISGTSYDSSCKIATVTGTAVATAEFGNAIVVNLVMSGPTSTESSPASQTGKPATTGTPGTQVSGASGTPSGTSTKTSSGGRSKAAGITRGITIPIVAILLLMGV